VLVAACAVAGGVLVGLRLAKSSPSARHPASASSVAPFKDGDGLIVFQQQPSGLLGTADPDGSHQAMDMKLGGLQGTDLPTGSPDGRYLVNQEAQLLPVGAHLPSAATQIALPNPQAADQSGGGVEWMPPTFADGSRYLAVTECDPIGQAGFFGNEAWASWLIPIGGGKPSSLGLVTSSAGLPGAPEVIAALPANPAAARQYPACDGEQVSDGSLAILAPGEAPHVILTAAALVKAAGWKASTPVILDPVPSPDGNELLVSVQEDIQISGAALESGRIPTILAAQFLVSPAGRIMSELPSLRGTFQPVWSPDGRQLATCYAVRGQQSSVTLFSVTGGRAAVPRTIPLPGRHDLVCNQLLWSPDGTQLIYSAFATRGLTQADSLQHGWTIIDLATGKVHDVTAPGQPAAWLPATG
jgi:WD40-like Beta Propeller Repeat